MSTNICNDIQSSFTRAFIVGEFALYIVVVLSSNACVVFDASTTGFDNLKYLCDTSCCQNHLKYTIYARMNCILVLKFNI